MGLHRNCTRFRALKANLGFCDSRGKNWDFGISPWDFRNQTCVKLGFQSQPKLGFFNLPLILRFHTFGNWDFRISPHLNRDFGIPGLPLSGP